MSEYPDGIISPDDEGELKIALYIRNGKMILDFGKEISWMGFDKQTLRQFITGLKRCEAGDETDGKQPETGGFDLNDNDKIQYALIALLRHYGHPVLIDLNWLKESIESRGELKIEHLPAKNAVMISFVPCTVEEFAEKYGLENLGPVGQAEIFIGRKKADETHS